MKKMRSDRIVEMNEADLKSGDVEKKLKEKVEEVKEKTRKKKEDTNETEVGWRNFWFLKTNFLRIFALFSKGREFFTRKISFEPKLKKNIILLKILKINLS